MNREITDKNLHLLLPGKVSLFAKIYAEEKGGLRKRRNKIMALRSDSSL